MTPWLLALALLCFLEGAVIAISPEKWQQAMRQLTQVNPKSLRKFGIILVVIGFIIVICMILGGL